MTARADIPPGTRFGRLVVTAEGPPRYARRARTLVCRCDCGNEPTVLLQLLLNASTRSCGCLRRETMASANAARHLVILALKERNLQLERENRMLRAASAQLMDPAPAPKLPRYPPSLPRKPGSGVPQAPSASRSAV